MTKDEKRAIDFARRVDPGLDLVGRPCLLDESTIRPSGRHTPGVGYPCYTFDVVTRSRRKVAYVVVNMETLEAKLEERV